MSAYDDGKNKDGSVRYELLQDGQGGMTSTAIPDDPENKSALCSTLGFVAVPQVAQAMRKNLTWSDKLPDWLTSILEPKWSEKLAAVSTSKDRSSLPYQKTGSKTPPFTAAFLDFECRLLEL